MPARVRALIRSLHPALKKRIRAALADILVDPSCGKPLKGELEGYWSLRVGRHRIIYKAESEGIAVAAIGPRQTIYEDAARQLVSRSRRKT